MKTCTRCRLDKPATTEFFPKGKTLTAPLRTVCKECVAVAARSTNKPSRDKLRVDVLTKYGSGVMACMCCGDSHEEFLTLDHINGGGKQERERLPGTSLYTKLRANGYPDGYQTLCYNCNGSLGRRGYCPHRPDVKREVVHKPKKYGR